MAADERKRPQRQGSGWLTTSVGAVLLVAAGFGVGLVAGTAYEEPELVAAHLTGHTVEVALDTAAKPEEPAALDDVAAAPPPAAPAAPVSDDPLPTPLGAGALGAPRTATPARTGPSPAAVSARAALAAPPARPGAKTAGFAIQVGAFATEGTAQQLASELEKRGFPSYVTEQGAGARFKVRVGPIGSRAEAEQLSARLKSQHRLPTWILSEPS